MPTRTARLLITCPDRSGIIAEVTGMVRDLGGNVLDADQHSDPDEGRFFMRLEIDRDGFDLGGDSAPGPWSDLARQFEMDWRLSDGAPKRVAIFSGPETHCVADLLWRMKTGELEAEVVAVVSNHESIRALAEPLGFPFHHVPVTPETREPAEGRALSLLKDLGTDVVVLARYMQILSPGFVAAYPRRIINIHHSFLPAFLGARPYHQAFDRGVKLIGATSHYVTDDLDQGPIIAQRTAPISHRDAVSDLVRKGRDLERIVLAHAIRMHLQDRIIVHGTKTVVFE